MTIDTVAMWHDIIRTRNSDKLDEILADECVFHSPVVHTPQEGKAKSKLYLSLAMMGLSNEFNYVREIVGDHEAILEFTTKLGDIEINGIDMFRWREDGKIVDFKVMIRPLKAITMVHQMMGAALQQGSSPK